MIAVLHGTWLPAESRLFLWGEVAQRSTRRRRQGKLPAHPAQLAVEALHERLAGLPSSIAVPPERELTIWLPAVGSAPLPGRELRAAGVEAPPGVPTLAPWRVRGLLLSPEQTIDLLLGLATASDIGGDLRAWRVATLLVLELVAGQQLLPGLVRDGQRLRAAWQPRPDPATAGRIATLARALPPLCRAVVDDPARAIRPRDLLDAFLATVADALVRDLAASDQTLAPRLNRLPKGPLPPGAAWLAALLTTNPALQLQGREADELFKAWQAWAGQEQIAGDESFRITFRLEPPSDDRTPWVLSYMLQATDDPSLLVPAGQLWRERGQLFHYLDRRFEHPQERLLRGLGFAARLVPPIERSLRERAPEQATLSTAEAFSFLKEAAPLLEQSGFGVLLPGWWGGPGRLRARARAAPRKAKRGESQGMLSFESMLSFRWELSVGDQPIDRAEFERLVALKQPLVRVRGEWVALDPNQIKQALALMERGGNLSMGEALRMGLGGAAPQLPSGIAFDGLEAEGAFGELLRQLTDSTQMEQLPQPASFQGTLRPYQERGFSWMAFMRRYGLGACLADDMGLGKCLLGSSLIFVNGTLKTAEQIWEHYADAPAFDGEGFWGVPKAALLVNAIDATTGELVCAPVQRLYRQHVHEPLRTVRLEDGSSITITRSHKLLTSKGWTAQIGVGDYVCVPARLKWEGAPADLDLIRLLAWRIAEGSSAEKVIPDLIMQSDDAGIRVFLRNYFDAEASVVQSMASIEIATAAPVLIQQLVTLLRRLGIWMRVSQKRKRATNGTGIYRVYQIGVIGGNSARRFLSEVGFGNLYKQQLLEQICANAANTNVEGIPASELVAAGLRATRLPVRMFGMHNTVYLNGSQQFSRRSLEQVVAGVDTILSGRAEQTYRKKRSSRWTAQTLAAFAQLDRQELSTTRQQLQNLLDQEVFFCRVKSVDEQIHAGWVYDLEVAAYHNFVANNILCHNTAQTIALLLHEQATAPGLGPTLLVCPTSVVGNWQRELARFGPSLSVLVHQGAERLRGPELLLAANDHDVVLSSFPLLVRDRDSLTAISWRLAVIDEAQNIKNSETRQAQAAQALRSQARVALTGTPVENRLTELWSIMSFLNPGYLGGETEFRRTFARPIERASDIGAAAQLRRITAPFILRRLKSDPTIISDLPEKIEMKVFVPLTQEQATLYEATVRDALAQIESAEQEGEQTRRRGLVLAMLTRLKQVCNHPAQLLKDGSPLPGRSGKLARLDEMLEEVLAADDRALIFTQFAEMGALLQQYFAERLFSEALFLYGGTPAKDRDGMVRRFQAPEGPRLFILSLKAGGVGLNLTHANHVFHFDRWWNPAVEDQATDRAFRIGQTRNVQVHKFVCGGTLEERIDSMIEGKRALAAQVLGTGESWLTEFSTDQLRELVALRREEISD